MKGSSWGLALALGVEIAVAVIAGKFLGEWIDRSCGTQPWGVVGGIFLFSSVAMFTLLRKLQKDFDAENPDSKE
jgi:F0F1-type ATP synthase assembly protein I